MSVDVSLTVDIFKQSLQVPLILSVEPCSLILMLHEINYYVVSLQHQLLLLL